MEDYLRKKQLIQEELKKLKLDKTFIAEEEESCVVYKSTQSLKNSKALLILSISNSVFAKGIVYFATLDDVGKKEKILRYFNELNDEYIPYKFIVDNEKSLYAQFTYSAVVEDFNANTFIYEVIRLFTLIHDEIYAEVMRIMWS